jgi:hypothetical protein
MVVVVDSPGLSFKAHLWQHKSWGQPVRSTINTQFERLLHKSDLKLTLNLHSRQCGRTYDFTGDSRLERGCVDNDLIIACDAHNFIAAREYVVSCNICIEPQSKESDSVAGPFSKHLGGHLVKRHEGSICIEEINEAFPRQMSGDNASNRPTVDAYFRLLANFLTDKLRHSFRILFNLTNRRGAFTKPIASVVKHHYIDTVAQVELQQVGIILDHLRLLCIGSA